MRISLLVLLLLAVAGPAHAQEKPALPDGAVALLGTHRLRVSAEITGTAFTPDHRTFVVVYREPDEKKPNVVLFNVATGLERTRLDVCNARHLAMARHKPLLALTTDKGLEVWDLAAEKRVQQLPYSKLAWYTRTLAISPDGSQVVAVRSEPDKTLRWDTIAGKALPPIYPPNGSLRFSADGSKVLTIDNPVRRGLENPTAPGALVAWDAKSGAKLAELRNDHDYVKFSPDGAKVARSVPGVGEKRAIEIIDFDPPGKNILTIPSDHWYFSFTPDGKQLVIHSKGQSMRLWDIAANKEVRTFEGKAWSGSPQFTQDGRLVAVIDDRWDARSWSVQFWDMTTGKLVRFATGHPDAVNGLAYSPDGRWLATISLDMLFLFDARTGAELRRWSGHNASVETIAFSPDGRLLASGAADGTIALWDPATGRERSRFTAKDSVRSLAFTPDGATLIAVSKDRTVQSWDVEKRAVQGSYQVAMKFAFPSISPTGHHLAYLNEAGDHGSNRSVLHWMNARTGKNLPPIDLRRDKIKYGDEVDTRGIHAWAFTFSRDGKLVATSDSLQVFGFRHYLTDHAIRVWETATRREILRFTGNPFGTHLLAISPDGRTLAHGIGEYSGSGRAHYGKEHTIILRDIAAAQSVFIGSKENDYGARPEVLQKLFRQIGGHLNPITCLAFSPDSKFIATGGADHVVYIWRVEDFVKRPILPEVKGDVAPLWQQLADANAGKAYQAIAQLERQPAKTVALLRKYLQPVAAVDAKLIAQHLRDLSSENFAARQLAHEGLERTGEQAAPLLHEALKNQSSLEMKRRLETVLEKLERPLEEPGQVRAYRCLVLLERIGTPEAQRFLMELSKGAPAWLTTEARYSLKRLAGQ